MANNPANALLEMGRELFFALVGLVFYAFLWAAVFIVLAWALGNFGIVVGLILILIYAIYLYGSTTVGKAAAS